MQNLDPLACVTHSLVDYVSEGYWRTVEQYLYYDHTLPRAQGGNTQILQAMAAGA
jgi:regulator of sigma D